MAETGQLERRLDILSTVLLALATIATAWAAYQARQWTGEQALDAGRATATRIEANRTSGVADRQVQIDVATFIAWTDARQQGNAQLADFYRTRFRDEFKPVFAAWLATNPLRDENAPETPFAMPQYRPKTLDEADRLEGVAAAQTNEAAEANQRANNYTLAIVLFASALFFAAISMKLPNIRIRIVLLGLGCAVFLGTAIWLVTFPTHVSV
jgi:hypothetical protein